MTGFVDRFKWKNRVKGEPVDISMCQPWNGAHALCFKCSVCDVRIHRAYEVTIEWGDTGEYDSTDYLCTACTERLFDCSRNAHGKKVHQVACKKEVPDGVRCNRHSMIFRTNRTIEKRLRIKPSAARAKSRNIVATWLHIYCDNIALLVRKKNEI